MTRVWFRGDKNWTLRKEILLFQCPSKVHATSIIITNTLWYTYQTHDHGMFHFYDLPLGGHPILKWTAATPPVLSMAPVRVRVMKTKLLFPLNRRNMVSGRFYLWYHPVWAVKTKLKVWRDHWLWVVRFKKQVWQSRENLLSLHPHTYKHTHKYAYTQKRNTYQKVSDTRWDIHLFLRFQCLVLTFCHVVLRNVLFLQLPSSGWMRICHLWACITCKSEGQWHVALVLSHIVVFYMSSVSQFSSTGFM